MVNTERKSKPVLTAIKQFFTSNDSQGGLRDYLIRGTLGVFTLQLVATSLGFVTNILLARFLGATQYGVYSYVFAWVGLLTVLSMFGFGRLLVREIASYQTNTEWGLIHGLLRFVSRRTFLLSICVSIVVGVATWLSRDNLYSQMFPAFWVALAILPILTLTILSGDALQGFRRVILGRIPQVLIRAPLFLALIVFVYWFDPQDFAAVDAVFLSLIASIVAVLAGFWLLYNKAVPHSVLVAKPAYEKRSWLRGAIPLLVVAGLFEINNHAPVILLGTLAGPKEAGIYAVAALITGFISFILLSANSTLSPVISSLYISGEMIRLQKIVTRSARFAFVIALGVAVLLIVFRAWLLFLFGQEFEQSGTVLIILTVGQLVNVAAGSVGNLLVMTGHERYTLIAIAISSVVAVILSIILIPRLGVGGAAIATATGMIFWNFMLIIQVHRQLGIDPTIFGLIKNQ